MPHAAIIAAVFGGALFSASASSFAILTDAYTTNTNKPASVVRAAERPERPAAKRAAVQAEAKPTMVTVDRGDTLTKIATDHKSTYTRLYDANTSVEHPDKIYPGEELRVPKAEEALASRPMPKDAVVPPAPAPVAAPQATPALQATTAQQAPVAAPAPAPAPAPSPAATVAAGSVWDRLAQCEAGGNWSINTGNGFYGGLQFTLSSWRAAGGTGYPHQASREEQILRGERLLAMQGWGAWPACTAKMGLR